MLHGHLGEGGWKGQALSGLRVLKFDGAVAPRVLKFDSGYAAEGCGGRLRRGRDRDRGGACLYSRRLTPCGRGLMAPPGLTALGAKGSVRDRLTPPGRVECSALGRYIVSLRWRGGRPFGRHFLCRLWRRKPDNRPAGEEMHPFWWLAPPPSPRRGDFILRYALVLFCPCAHPA